MNGDAVIEIAHLAKRPEVVTAAGVPWLLHPKDWTLADPERLAKTPAPLILHTLSGLLDYLRANRDELILEQTMVHVLDPHRVNVLSKLQPLAQRHCFATAGMASECFLFGRFYDCESFIVALQTMFVPGEDLARVLSLVGNIRDEKVASHEDDGVTQTVTAKAGIALVQQVKAPNPVVLRPYRTFREIEQPESKFVFRMQAGKDGGKPSGALFEADGGAWKYEAVHIIATFLRAGVPGGVSVIA